MILNVVRYGDPVLRQKGARIAAITPEVRTLVDDMLETMHAHEGVGLAAQQIGKALQLAVIDVTGITKRPSKMWIGGKEVNPDDHMPVLLINPVLELTKKKITEGEGCLSFPRVYGEVPRSFRVKVTTQKLDGTTWEFETTGLLGRAVQHEFDHLQGVLFIDRMDEDQRDEIRPLLEMLKRGELPPEEEDDESEAD